MASKKTTGGSTSKSKSKNPASKRNYKKEYADYHSKPEQRANRSARTLARRAAEKEGRVSKGDGKEIDHQPAVRKGASARKGKTVVVSRAKNRAWRKGKKGYDK